MKYQRARGTRDFYPEEMEARKVVFDSLRAVASKYGFGEVEAPAFENVGLLTAKSGEEVKGQIFTLDKRGNEEFGLRFDLTVPITRMFIEKQKELAKPVKWYYITRMWRYEAPQKGRLREFYQFGVELFGSEDASADAECISLAIDCMLNLGLDDKDFFVKINNRKLLEGILNNLSIKKIEDVIKVIDKADKIDDSEFEKELGKLKLDEKQLKGVKKIMKTKDLKDVDEKKLDDEGKEGLEEVKKVMKLLKDYGKDKFVRFDLSVARGLGYYTGTVFECFNSDESLRAIFGGGRYDKMIEQFGGESCAATGFAMGDVTLQLLLEDRGEWPKYEGNVDYYIAPVNDKVRKDAVKIANRLREKNKVDIDLMGRKLGKQLEYAANCGAKKIVIVGEKDLANKEVTVRNMESGKEKKVKIEDLE